jgi:hypothetical protein
MLSRLLQANRFVPIVRALRRRILKCFSQARKKQRQAFVSQRFGCAFQI